MLKALRDFTACVTDATGTIHHYKWHQGTLIAEATLEKELVALGCPVAAPDDDVTVSCERCGTTFDWTAHKVDATIAVVNAGVPWNGYTFSWRQGEVINPSLVDVVKAAGIPVKVVAAARCPNDQCAHVFMP